VAEQWLAQQRAYHRLALQVFGAESTPVVSSSLQLALAELSCGDPVADSGVADVADTRSTRALGILVNSVANASPGSGVDWPIEVVCKGLEVLGLIAGSKGRHAAASGCFERFVCLSEFHGS
jgi:hypothetical protein